MAEMGYSALHSVFIGVKCVEIIFISNDLVPRDFRELVWINEGVVFSNRKEMKDV